MYKDNKRRINKVLLIFPPTKIVKHSHKPCSPPLGIMYIASVLRKEGYNVKILDATVEGYYNEEVTEDGFKWYGLSFHEIKRRIAEFKPDVVGISCLFSAMFSAVRKICIICKDLDKNIITLTGGTHPSFLVKKCLSKVPELDYILIGESELTTRILLKKINEEEDIKKIKGLAYRINKRIIITKQNKKFENLDKLPMPAIDLVPINKYFSIGSPHTIFSKERKNLPMITSRGCSLKCTYCSSTQFWKGGYRTRSVKNVILEVRSLKRYANEIQFCDDNLTLNKERVKELFHKLAECDIVWNASNGIAIWTLDNEMIKLMKKSGCYSATLAIENGNQEILHKMRKQPIKLNQIRSIVKLMKNEGIETHSFFLVGHPDETIEQVNKTFNFAKELDLDSASFYILQPLPGSELNKMLIMEKIIDENFDYENINYFSGSYDTKYFKKELIEKKIANQFLRLNLSLIYRHPLRFISKYRSYFSRNPLYTIKFILRMTNIAISTR